MQSKKATSAGNKQERLEIENWIAGFTDGEGCFSVSFIKNGTTKTGWQIFPEFVITQGAKSLSALKIFQKYFKCGNLIINRRKDNHTEHLYRYCVRKIEDLDKNIIPFFKKHHLKTDKQKDFMIFSKIISLMKKGEHRSKKGMKKIAKLVEKMNRKKKSRFLESSETKRQLVY